MLVQREDLEINGCTNSEMPNEGWVVDLSCSRSAEVKELKSGEKIQVSFL